MDLFTVVYQSQGRFEEMLQDAENERRIKQLRKSQSGLQRRVLLRIGDFLIAAGAKLKAHHQPEPTVLAMNTK